MPQEYVISPSVATIELKEHVLEIDRLFSLKRLEQVSIVNSKVNGSTIGKLKGLNISRLCLVGNQLDDQALAELPELPKLRELFVVFSQVDGNGLSALKRVPFLEKLDLSDNRFLDDVGIFNLPTLTKLRTLSLKNSHVSAIGVANVVTRHRSIEYLDLSGTKVRLLKECRLETLPHLKRLYVGSIELSVVCYEYLSQLKSLEELSFKAPWNMPAKQNLTENDLERFPLLNNLKVLDVSSTRISEKCLRLIPVIFPNLESLVINGGEFSNEAIFVKVKNLLKLTKLEISDSTYFKNQALNIWETELQQELRQNRENRR